LTERLPRAALDSNVIFSRVLHELFGRVAAEARLLDLFWGEPLLTEAERVLIERKPVPPRVAARWVSYPRQAFPGGEVDINKLDPAIDLATLTSDSDDQHICAVAILAEGFISQTMISLASRASTSRVELQHLWSSAGHRCVKRAADLVHLHWVQHGYLLHQLTLGDRRKVVETGHARSGHPVRLVQFDLVGQTTNRGRKRHNDHLAQPLNSLVTGQDEIGTSSMNKRLAPPDFTPSYAHHHRSRVHYQRSPVARSRSRRRASVCSARVAV
jgi:hypothetical protein